MNVSLPAASPGPTPGKVAMTQVEQLLDFYAFLIQANGLVARADNSVRLYEDICRLGIQLDQRMVLAWVGMLDAEERLRIVARTGPATGFLADIDIGVLAGQYPVREALGLGHCTLDSRICEIDALQPWHARARDFGIAACAAVPLRRNGAVCGVLMLYAGATDVFEDNIADELEVLAQTLSYALDTAAQRERDQRQAERWRALLRLAQTDDFDGTEGEFDFLQRALEEARRLTGSRIGFIYLISADQQGCDQMARAGATDGDAKYLDQLNPVGPGSIWVGSFPDHRGQIINDYPNAGNGPPRVRLITVPVVDNDKVCAIAWIGGKEDAYDQDDLEFLQILAADAWRIVRRHRAEDGLHEAHNQLLQSEKMASIGQLAAGVAHEINNPIGFVNSNLGTLGNYIGDLLRLAEAAAACPEGKAVADKIDLDFLRGDIPALLAESKDGLNRVRKIVQDLKDFSRVGEVHWQSADLHQGLDSTLNIVNNEIKYKCSVTKQYGVLPPIYCLPSQLNQVFMNLLVNAAQAIEKHGEILIRTECVGTHAVRVSISDTGSGIPPEHLNRLFEPFFTTKPVGKGTGLGLSLAWGIIARHHGRIDVESKVGKGTTFTITLPIKPPVITTDSASVAVPPTPTF
jgi:signal transduction histidine kinase